MLQETAAVRRGAKLLDSLVPNWPKKIRKAALKLSDPNQCVLGQVWGDFFDGVREMSKTAVRQALRNSPLRAIRTESGDTLAEALTEDVPVIDDIYYGFNVQGDEEDSENAAFESLGQAWLREIDARRG